VKLTPTPGVKVWETRKRSITEHFPEKEEFWACLDGFGNSQRRGEAVVMSGRTETLSNFMVSTLPQRRGIHGLKRKREKTSKLTKPTHR